MLKVFQQKCSEQQSPCHMECAADQAQRHALPCSVAVAVRASVACVQWRCHVYTAVSCGPAQIWLSDSCPVHCRQSVVQCPSQWLNHRLHHSAQNVRWACWHLTLPTQTCYKIEKKNSKDLHFTINTTNFGQLFETFFEIYCTNQFIFMSFSIFFLFWLPVAH